MDNKAFDHANGDKAANGNHKRQNGGQANGHNGGQANASIENSAPESASPKEKKFKKIRSISVATKHVAQGNKVTEPCFPPKGDVGILFTLTLGAISVFLSARGILGEIAAPGGTIFALEVLILLALIGGKLLELLGKLISHTCKCDLKLPPLLGMLLVGVLLKNIPYNLGQFGRADCVNVNQTTKFVDSLHDSEHNISFKRSIPDDVQELYDIGLGNHDIVKRSFSAPEESHEPEGNSTDDCKPRYIGHDLDPFISRTLRSICLTVILLMAGLELDPVALLKLSGMVIRATFIPCFVEAVAVAVLANLILGFPWMAGFMLGFVLAAVSPAVIIPCLMSLSQRGYGVAKGIPTLVIAACSADDVVAISGFGIFLGFTFNSDAPLLKLILHGPIEILIGISFGIVWGVLAQWIPNKHHKNVIFFRWLILFGGGLVAIFGAHAIHYDGAGGLAAITMSFVAGMRWRKEGWHEHNPIMKLFTKMWIVLEPIIFALIGTEIQIDKIDPETMAYGVLVLVGALIIRMAGTFVAVMGGDLNFKERIFMAFAWMPKATVQAALGPIALDMAKRATNPDPQLIFVGEQILTLAVLAILISAPLGSVSILALGPRLLESDQDGAQREEDEELGEKQKRKQSIS